MFLKYYLHQLNSRVERLERQIIHKYLGANNLILISSLLIKIALQKLNAEVHKLEAQCT